MSPLKFGRCLFISGLVEKPTADLVANECFPGGCVCETQGLFLQSRRFMPLVLSLIGLREHEQRAEPTCGTCQIGLAFFDRLLGPSKKGQNPYPFQCRTVLEPTLHRFGVQNHITQRRGVCGPNVVLASHQALAPPRNPRRQKDCTARAHRPRSRPRTRSAAAARTSQPAAWSTGSVSRRSALTAMLAETCWKPVVGLGLTAGILEP